MIILNEDKIQEYQKELNKYTEYLPLILYEYIDIRSYFDRIDNKVKLRCYEIRSDIQKVSNYEDFLEFDLINWLEENPKYKDIILGKTND